MADTFYEHLARQCATARLHFGPTERQKGVQDHILKEFDEINELETATERAEEWVDVVILSLDGLLRATRQGLREQITTQHPDGAPPVLADNTGNPIAFNSEPTNDWVAFQALKMIRSKQTKNEIRDFGDWRQASEDHAMEHKKGIHD